MVRLTAVFSLSDSLRIEFRRVSRKGREGREADRKAGNGVATEGTSAGKTARGKKLHLHLVTFTYIYLHLPTWPTACGHPKGWTPNPGGSGRSFLSPLVAGFKVCQVCLARVYRGFRILDPCTTRVRKC
jgi:hypothetical protein